MSWIFRFIPISTVLLLAGIAVGAIALGHVHYEIEKRKARENGVPEAVTASQLPNVRSFPWYEEVTVQVQFQDELSYVYWEDTAHGEVEFPIMFFFDPTHEGPVRQVLGAIAFDSFEAEDMLAYLGDVYQEDGALGAIFKLTGTRQFLPYVTYAEVEVAAEDLGVEMSPNFLYIDPYFRGRETRVQARPELTYAVGGLSMVLIWFSMVASIMRKRRANTQEPQAVAKTIAKKGLIATAFGGAKVLFASDDEGGMA